MDLNRLYSDHQMCTFKAAQSHSTERKWLLAEASRIARQIVRFQHSLGAKAAFGWERLAM